MKDLGPYEENNIYVGECSEMMQALPDDCIDLTVTSPPYDNLRDYNGFTFDYKPVIEQLYRVTAVGGVVVWVVADAVENKSKSGTSFKQALYFIECGFNLHQRLFYEKGGPPPDSTRYDETIEEMFVFSKGKPKAINLIYDKKNKWAGEGGWGRNHTTREKDGTLTKKKRVITAEIGKRTVVWKYANGKHFSSKDKIAFNHPAIFPEALARDHIISWSNPGDIVLDPFMGSGTTAKMAMQNGRSYLGFDISEEYVKLAQKRVTWANPPLLVID